jgi:hypothetical protein
LIQWSSPKNYFDSHTQLTYHVKQLEATQRLFSDRNPRLLVLSRFSCAALAHSIPGRRCFPFSTDATREVTHATNHPIKR